jgi:hypothetical protein
VLSLNTYLFLLLPIPTAKRTKRTGVKAPEEDQATGPDSNLAPEDPDGNAPDEDSAHKHTDADSNYSNSSDAGKVSGSDTSVGSKDDESNEDEEDPGEEFDERELGDCGDLESINCHDETETRTPILSLSESVSYETLF